MDHSDNTCLVCHEAIEIFAIGQCDHPICFKCCTRMRALCEQFYCSICRTDLPEVFFMSKKEKFGQMPMRKFILNRKMKIQFENDDIRQKFEELLEYRCKICKGRFPEKSFKALQDHMRRVHTLFYCDLCLELKIFPNARKVYNRQELASHRRLGDKDDMSYKGHPLCQFCDERYLDKDELYKHLRKDHYYCHFCESQGSQEFFADYTVLKNHFRAEHYLCEEGECANIEFETAFRSEIDMTSHRATHHSKAVSKMQSRQERTLNIDINLVPRPSNRGRGVINRNDYEEVRNTGPQHQGSRGGRGGRGGRQEYEDSRRDVINRNEEVQNSGPQHQGSRGGRSGRQEYEDSRRGGPRHQGSRGERLRGGHITEREKQDVERALQASLSTMKEEITKKKTTATTKSDSSSEDEFVHNAESFPNLGESKTATTTSTSTSVTNSTNASLADRFAISHNMSVQHGVLGLGDFPTLNQTSDTKSASSSRPSSVPSTGRISPYKSAFSARKVEEDFPELPVGAKPSAALQRSWVNSEKQKSQGNSAAASGVTTKPTKQKRPSTASRKVTYNDSDFPSLGEPSVSSNSNWFKSGKDNQPNKKSNNNNNPVPSNVENDNFYVLDRYSPVNIPDSPKNKKKKKEKDKSNTLAVKDKKDVLKGNSSLDNIASLLLTSVTVSKPVGKEPKGIDKINQKSETEVETNHASKHVAPESNIPREKRKEDIIEKKLESTREKNYANDQQIEEIKKAPVKFTIADEEFPTLRAPAKVQAKPPPGLKQDGEVPSFKSSHETKKPVGKKHQPGKKEKEKSNKLTVQDKKDVLRSNSSLDGIASLLLSSVTLSKPVENEPQSIDKNKQKTGAQVETNHFVKPTEQIKMAPIKIADEEFPTLGAPAKVQTKPPPGFKTEAPSVKSPPGFIIPAGNKPPPGFVSQNKFSNLMSTKSETANGDFGIREVLPMSTNHSNFQYVQPDGFSDRNRLLVGIIQSCCSDDASKFADFKVLSCQFRSSETTADHYYKRCKEILGNDTFAEIFPELLALLPDIRKQQDLLSVFMIEEGMKKDDSVLKISGKSRNAKGAWTETQSGFLTCQTCRQVLLRKDYNSHGVTHNLDSDFPSLETVGTSANRGQSSGSWVKAK